MKILQNTFLTSNHKLIYNYDKYTRITLISTNFCTDIIYVQLH